MSQDTCMLCLQEIALNDSVLYISPRCSCEYAVHFSCGYQWLQHHQPQSCLLCRKEIKKFDWYHSYQWMQHYCKCIGVTHQRCERCCHTNFTYLLIGFSSILLIIYCLVALMIYSDYKWMIYSENGWILMMLFTYSLFSLVGYTIFRTSKTY